MKRLIKLAKYLKPFIFGILIAVALLFVQAISDLNLPNYMSDIINVGIQQTGIEHAAPDAVSQNGMNFIKTFLSSREKQLLDDNYTLVSKTDTNQNGKTYENIYPNMTEQIYVKNTDTDKQTMENLDKSIGISAWTFINYMKSVTPQGESQDAGGMSDIQNIDLEQLYQYLPMFAGLTEDMLKPSYDAAAANDESILKQSGVIFTKAFYEEIGVDVSDIQKMYIVKIGMFMLLISLIGGLSSVGVSYISSKISADVARRLRKDTFQKIESFSNSEFDKFSTASLITRCTNDITQVQMFVMMGMRMMFFAPIMGIGGVIMALNKSTSMSWIIAVAVVVLLGLISIVMAVALPKFKALQKLVDRLNLVSREALSGLMVIRAFGAENHEKKRFERANSDLTKTNLFISRVMVFMMPMMMLIMNGVSLLVVWVGAHQIAESSMQVGSMMAFIQYTMQIIFSFIMISMMFIFVPRAAVSGDRIAQVLFTENEIIDPKNSKSFDKSKKGLVEFKNVNFRYHGAEEDALHNITFTAKPGETTAIIGPTGAGKTTLLNLLMRFYDVTGGQVMVSGVDVKEVNQHELRDIMGYVPQKGVLISGTIESNIKYSDKEMADNDMQWAADIAQATKFITEKTDGFESEIAQGGTNVSGGQKQRISIARALAKHPQILLFDDSFSALDFKTDSELRKSLKENTGDSTVIVVAQRVSTIMNAEQILVIDNGAIVGKGTHKELLKNCPEYLEIASSQLSKEELA